LRDERLYYGIDLGPQIPASGIAQGFGIGRIEFHARKIDAGRQQQAESAATEQCTEKSARSARGFSGRVTVGGRWSS
jgi:hypothetical protein